MSVLLLGVALACGPRSAVAQAPAQPPAGDAPAILFVSPDDPDRPYNRAFADGLRQALNADGPRPTLYRESFDQARFGGDQSYVAEFRDWLHRKYRRRRIDAIVVRQQATLQLFERRPDNPWNDVPIVYSTLGALSIDIAATHPTASGVVMENPLPHLLDVIGRLLPGTRRIAVVRGASAHELVREAWWIPQIRAHGLEVEDLVDLPMPRLLARLADLPTDTVPIVFSFQQDRDGQYYEPGEVVPRLARAASRPLFTIVGDNLSSGLVGGPLPDYAIVGRAAGRHVLERLSGAPPRTMTVPVSAYVPSVFDARQLARWGIDEDRLPPGSRVHSRPPSLWRDYRGTVIGALAIGLFQSALVALVLVQRHHRARAQAELRASYVRLQDLTERLLTARDEERARIARDLHDDLGQRMASIAIGLGRVRRVAAELAPSVAEAIGQVQADAKALSGDLRELSHDLHPGALEHVGLVETLRERCAELASDTGIVVRLHASGECRDLPAAVALCLYRIAQEALQNVRVHAQARQVTVTLTRGATRVHLEVADDGRGIGEAGRRSRRGLGLTSIGERVRLLSGTFDIHGVPGEGTTMHVSLPIEPAPVPPSPVPVEKNRAAT
ncbi:hypothetical protein TBR22_A17720 [Luteitalea sp. TBR-22]|uniref:sensor histidine kinase n=1 Tax=Luteitalea sp. TBR-22 TaxID=2802971 RepID=UPI001EF628B7|nr:histidine kinase [Luteitalea sp. TBR-22]BCS32558.2 hypothetical protein TBR22_A17720 [Luteitalea sp. TBR-22]